jgi:hypothetical protein
MTELLVRYSKGKNLHKTWRLSKSPMPSTIGSSSKANLNLPGSCGIEGAFEFIDGTWWFLPMHPEAKTSTSMELGAESMNIQVGPHTLQVRVVEPKRRPDLANLPKLKGTETLGLKHNPQAPLTSTDRKIITAAVVLPLLLMLVSFVMPDTGGLKVAEEFERPQPVLSQTRMEKEKPKPKQPEQVKTAEKVVEGKKQQARESASTQQAQPQNPALQLRQGSLSNLVGKVSARSAQSREVVIARGEKAGTQPSSRAFAVAGAVSQQAGKSGLKDMGERDGIRVSTVGRGGGSDEYQGMGSLREGDVGRGNLDIIEEETEIGGGLAREIIHAYIRSQLGHILYCYERQLSATPDLYGQVSVRFTIGGTGGVVAQQIGQTTLKNATVEGCILRKVAQWNFPQPEGGTQVNVTYPFLFKSTR